MKNNKGTGMEQANGRASVDSEIEYGMPPKFGVDEDYFKLLEILVSQCPEQFDVMFVQTPGGRRKLDDWTHSLWTSAYEVSRRIEDLAQNEDWIKIIGLTQRCPEIFKRETAESEFEAALPKIEKLLPKKTRVRLLEKFQQAEEWHRFAMASLFVAIGFVMGVRAMEKGDKANAFKAYHVTPE